MLQAAWGAHSLIAEIGVWCAVLGLACALVGGVGGAVRARLGTAEVSDPRQSRAWAAALLLSTPPVVLLLVALIGRTLQIGSVLLITGPGSVATPADSPVMLTGSAGIAVSILVSATALCGLWFRRDERLGSAWIWCLMLVVVWTWAAGPAYVVTPAGHPVRAAGTLQLPVGGSLILVMCAWLHRGGAGDGACDPSSGARVPVRSCTALALIVSILICYHLAVPIRLGWGGYRGASILLAASAVTTGLAAMAICRVRLSSPLAESALVAGSLACAAACTVAIPERGVGPGERLPAVFVAVMIGLTAASLGWTLTARRIRGGKPLPGFSWALAEFARPLVIRSAFYCAAGAVLVSAMLAVWPRIAGVVTADDSLGRFAIGIAANLWLLLVLVVDARTERRPSFHLLALLTVISTGAFVAIRLWPYARKIASGT